MESGNKASKFLLDVCITFGIQSDILESFHLRNHCENYKDELEEFKILNKKISYSVVDDLQTLILSKLYIKA
jgi:hypothetical protein